LSLASADAAPGTAAAERSNLKSNAGRVESLLGRFQQIRNFTDTLCSGLKPEDYVVQSMPDVSPTKWHLAHTTWFFETFILKKFLTGYRAEIPEYAYLFNSYYNAAGDMHRRDLRGLISRPTVQETQRYRRSLFWAFIMNSNIRNCLSPTSNTCSRKIRSIQSFELVTALCAVRTPQRSVPINSSISKKQQSRSAMMDKASPMTTKVRDTKPWYPHFR